MNRHSISLVEYSARRLCIRIVDPSEGLMVELDTAEIHPDDPGQGTPAMVYEIHEDPDPLFSRNPVSKASASYHCALDTGELECGEYPLCHQETQWLASLSPLVTSFLDGEFDFDIITEDTKLYAPNGKQIIGTSESLLGTAMIVGPIVRGTDNTFEFQYDETKIHWDTITTETNVNGSRKFMDDDGGEWPESDLRLISEGFDVQEIKREAESHWDEHPDHPVEDWKSEVANDDTRQSYKEWVAARLT